MRTKLKLFNGTVSSILLYVCETWKGLKEVETKVRVLKSNCLRKTMDINWYEHITEEEVRRRSGQWSVIDMLRIHRQRYKGHVLRMCEERLPKHVLSWTPEGIDAVADETTPGAGPSSET